VPGIIGHPITGDNVQTNRRARQRGQTIVEFAVIAPIIFLFLFVIVDFGIAMDRRIVLDHAVREGARYAAVGNDIAVVCKRTRDQAQGLVGPGDITISYEDIDGNHQSTDAGDAVDVTIHYTYDPVLIRPIFSGLFGGTIGKIDMTPKASARLERSVAGDTTCPP
jgi:hypothetical protein